MLPHGNVCREVVLCRLHCLICHGLCTHTALAKASEDFGDMLAGNCQRHHIAWTACMRHRLHVQPVTTPRHASCCAMTASSRLAMLRGSFATSTRACMARTSPRSRRSSRVSLVIGSIVI